MTCIPEKDRDIIELAIYLPMVLTVLNRDLTIVETSPFKLKRPYVEWIQKTMFIIQQELSEVTQFLRKNNIKVTQVKNNEAFTLYLFLYKEYEEYHNYFNPRIRNKVEELMKHYLYERLGEYPNQT